MEQQKNIYEISKLMSFYFLQTIKSSFKFYFTISSYFYLFFTFKSTHHLIIKLNIFTIRLTLTFLKRIIILILLFRLEKFSFIFHTQRIFTLGIFLFLLFRFLTRSGTKSFEMRERNIRKVKSLEQSGSETCSPTYVSSSVAFIWVFIYFNYIILA